MANNPYVNQVGLADGTILIDLTSDTAVAADVKSGRYFHLATGERVQGTNTYDSDTTDANASASEILSGKTAYVNKNKITGEMTNKVRSAERSAPHPAHILFLLVITAVLVLLRLTARNRAN